MSISIIVAFSENRVIGKDGRIIWDFPCDRLHFKTITSGGVVIFGRRTFEEIGHALPNRINIVVSSTKQFEGENLFTAQNLGDAIKLAKKLAPEREIFLCGGERIYKEGLSLCDKIYVTLIHNTYSGDAFFPKIDETTFTSIEETNTEEKNVELEFITYIRKQ